jgi:hypothetical protein
MSKNSAHIAAGIGSIVQNGYAAYKGLTSGKPVEQVAGGVAAGQAFAALAGRFGKARTAMARRGHSWAS